MPLFGWAKRKLEVASASAMKDDIGRFIAGLRGADDYEIGSMIVLANSLRIKLLNMGKIPEAALDFSIPRDDDTQLQCDLCSVTLANAIKQFQKMGQPTDAFSAMVWLHSVRALNIPEIRGLGREMWGQLSRGFPYVDEPLWEMKGLVGDRLPVGLEHELMFVPRGLEPWK
jgi:hypothetical protein